MSEIYLGWMYRSLHCIFKDDTPLKHVSELSIENNFYENHFMCLSVLQADVEGRAF